MPASVSHRTPAPWTTQRRTREIHASWDVNGGPTIGNLREIIDAFIAGGAPPDAKFMMFPNSVGCSWTEKLTVNHLLDEAKALADAEAGNVE